MMNGDKKRYTFDPMKIEILVGESRECIEKFIPAIMKDIEGLGYRGLLESIASEFIEWAPIDVPSFRYGMYALAMELENQRVLREKISAGVRFIV